MYSCDSEWRRGGVEGRRCVVVVDVLLQVRVVETGAGEHEAESVDGAS